MMELLKCAQCGDRPGLLVTVTDRATGIEINLCYDCYKDYLKRTKDPDGKGKVQAMKKMAMVYDEGISER